MKAKINKWKKSTRFTLNPGNIPGDADATKETL